MSNYPSWWDDHAVRVIKQFQELSCQRRGRLQLMIIEAMKYASITKHHPQRPSYLAICQALDEMWKGTSNPHVDRLMARAKEIDSKPFCDDCMGLGTLAYFGDEARYPCPTCQPEVVAEDYCSGLERGRE